MGGVSLVATYVANAAWMAVLLAAAGWLAARCLKRLGPRAEHVGWVLSLGLATVVPAMPMLQKLLELIENRPVVGGHQSVVSVTATYSTPGFSGLFRLPAAALWGLAGCYIAVLLYAACRIGWSLYAAARLVDRALPLRLTAEQEELWNRCRRLFAARDVRLMTSGRIDAPVVLGIRKTVLLVPEKFVARCAPPDLLTALAHECAHAERQDFRKNLCYELAGLALAFHPAIWFMKAQIAETREMICDSMVAERVLGSRAYAQSLLRLAAMVAARPRTATAHAIGIFDANILEKRIMMMNRGRRPYGWMMRTGLTAASLLMLAVTCSVALNRAFAVEPETVSAADQASSSRPVYRVGKDVTAPTLIHSVDAEFPKGGPKLKAPFNAIVIVHVVVDKSGMPQDVSVLKSYNAAFDQEAMKAVEQYRFKPGMKAGVPVDVAVSIEVNFRLY